MIKKKLNTKGFILPEVTVTSFLMVIIVALVVFIMIWALRSFEAAEKTSILQKELRSEANYITSELRDAKESELLAEIDGFQQDYRFIYLENGKIMRNVNGESRTSGIEVEIIELKFIQISNLIEFTIVGSIDNEKYELKSSVLADNLFILDNNEGTAVKYQ